MFGLAESPSQKAGIKHLEVSVVNWTAKWKQTHFLAC